jgi:pilus assembly protein CpaB
MNGRSGILLILAAVCGLGAMLGVKQLMKPNNGPIKEREVLTAARDLKLEEVLKPDLVQVVRMPENAVPAGAFSSYKDVADRWVKFPMLAGEPILDPKLAPAGEPVGLIARIPDGHRAFTLEVNEQAGVAGFVMPDHRVDVMLARQRGSANGIHMESELILQDVLVLASGQSITRPEDTKVTQVRSVTLAVTPDQVNKLNAARTEGNLTLALRGNNDHAKVEVAETKPEKAPVAVVETVPVVVAARDLEEGAVLGPTDLKIDEVPRDLFERLPEPFDAASAIVGRALAHRVPADSPVLASHLEDPSKMAKAEPARPVVRARPGHRVFAVKLAELGGTPNTIRSGDRVDLLWAPANKTPAPTAPTAVTATPGAPLAPAAPNPVDAIESPGSTLLAQNVQVLLTPWEDVEGVNPGEGKGADDVVLLEVPAIQVTALQHALGHGTMRLVVRPEDDDSIVSHDSPTPGPILVIHHGTRKAEQVPLFRGAAGPDRLITPDGFDRRRGPGPEPAGPSAPDHDNLANSKTLAQVER